MGAPNRVTSKLILLDRLQPGANAVVPLCRGLAIPREGGAVFLNLASRARSPSATSIWSSPATASAATGAFAAHLNAANGGVDWLLPLEIRLWADAGRILVVSSGPLRTEIIEQRVLLGANGQPLQIAENICRGSDGDRHRGAGCRSAADSASRLDPAAGR